MSTNADADGRANRERIIKFGYVRYGPHRHKVLVCDRSPEGAHLRTEHVGQVGDWLEFTVGETSRRAQIRWIRDGHMGVQYESALKAINGPSAELGRVVERFRDARD